MKILWCWRCKADVPMLEEHEFLRLKFVEPGKPAKESFESTLREYERITGFRETNINAVAHHRVALYGSPCTHCGKPLRTIRAKFCGHCMKPVL